MKIRPMCITSMIISSHKHCLQVFCVNDRYFTEIVAIFAWGGGDSPIVGRVRECPNPQPEVYEGFSRYFSWVALFVSNAPIASGHAIPINRTPVGHMHIVSG